MIPFIILFCLIAANFVFSFGMMCGKRAETRWFEGWSFFWMNTALFATSIVVWWVDATG